MLVVGVLSGTSVDGIDVAVVEISHTTKEHLYYNIKQIAFETIPWSKEDRALILNLCKRNSNLSVQDVCNANFILGKRFGEAILQVVNNNNLDLSKVQAVGSHGRSFPIEANL